MKETRHFIQAVGKDFFFKLILILLLYSLVPLAEIFLFIYLGELIGNYLVLIIAAVAGMGGALIALSQVQAARERLRAQLKAGRYPGKEFADLAGILVSGILLITPGFITDLLGYLLMIPALRGVVRGLVRSKLDRSFKDIYAYLRLSSL
ncbi:MAG: FxsA family protein [Spirochaetia bacterium]|nr:FxsA family protein [Spirochaetia bacterium]